MNVRVTSSNAESAERLASAASLAKGAIKSEVMGPRWSPPKEFAIRFEKDDFLTGNDGNATASEIVGRPLDLSQPEQASGLFVPWAQRSGLRH